jgi:hypothetical protein
MSWPEFDLKLSLVQERRIWLPVFDSFLQTTVKNGETSQSLVHVVSSTRHRNRVTSRGCTGRIRNWTPVGACVLNSATNAVRQAAAW